MMTCNVITPQLFWIKKLRRSVAATFIISIFVNIGMWFERFVIIVTSLHRDYLPSSWIMYWPTQVEVGVFVGTFGIFLTLYMLFAKAFPVIAIAEVKAIMKTSSDTYRAEEYAEWQRKVELEKAGMPHLAYGTPLPHSH